DLHPGQVGDYYARPEEAFGKTRCLVPWLEAEILPNGDVTPCSDRPDLIVGNVRKEHFQDIWSNDAYRAFRRAMREDGLVPYCSRCCGLCSHCANVVVARGGVGAHLRSLSQGPGAGRAGVLRGS